LFSQDPKEDDKALWTATDHYLHKGLDPETAKFILRYTAEEFCKMVKQEMDVRGHYFGKKFFFQGFTPLAQWPNTLLTISRLRV
jgi:hypothetical protein